MSSTTILTLLVDHHQVCGQELENYPVWVCLQDEALKKAADLEFRSEDGQTQLDHAVEAFDKARGELSAWVRVPRLSSSVDTIIQLCECNSSVASQDVWDADYRVVLHHPACGTVQHNDTLNMTNAITVEAWVDVREARAEALQSLVSKWELHENFGPFDAYDASKTDGLDTTGFFGAVFDGRYVYFSPQHDSQTRHGKALRYDTHGHFNDASSWSAYDAGYTDGLGTKGYYGAVFDGRYVIYPPRRGPDGFHSRVLRYDTQGNFTDPKSWAAYDAGVANSCQSAAFAGRYIYFCPGQYAQEVNAENQHTNDSSPKVTGMNPKQLLISNCNILRYDTQGDFKAKSSWTTYDASNTSGLDTRDLDGAVYDGRHIYFAPLAYAAPLRYDTRGDFHDPANWSAYHAAKLGMKRCVGAIFDGRHIYYVPYGECSIAVRYDTQEDFADDHSWSAYQLPETEGLDVLGYDGAFFDGRYVYYIPYWDEGKIIHGVMLRYDTQGNFTDRDSWDCIDAGQTKDLRTTGFNGGACDGRYLYLAAWMETETFTGRIGGGGRILRYDTVGNRGSFDLRFCDLGHNGGLCAAVPGPRFLVNTVEGPRSIAANRNLPTGRHHLAGVYDGETISLYIDGELANSQPASGQIITNQTDLSIGQVLHGRGRFTGKIDLLCLSSCARSADWIGTQYNNLSDPAIFCHPVTERGARCDRDELSP